jgi:hypothetical protein
MRAVKALSGRPFALNKVKQRKLVIILAINAYLSAHPHYFAQPMLAISNCRLSRRDILQIINRAQRIPVVALTLDVSAKRYHDGTVKFRPEG